MAHECLKAYVLLDLLDSGCLSRTPTHCHSAVKPQRPRPSKCPLFPIRKERIRTGGIPDHVYVHPIRRDLLYCTVGTSPWLCYSSIGRGLTAWTRQKPSLVAALPPCAHKMSIAPCTAQQKAVGPRPPQKHNSLQSLGPDTNQGSSNWR